MIVKLIVKRTRLPFSIGSYVSEVTAVRLLT